VVIFVETQQDEQDNMIILCEEKLYRDEEDADTAFTK
jgi:hypothetical protein